jgi:hypothetical protein
MRGVILRERGARTVFRELELVGLAVGVEVQNGIAGRLTNIEYEGVVATRAIERNPEVLLFAPSRW